MAGALAMTLGDQAKRLVSIIRNLTTDEARKLINRAFLECSQAHGWLHLLKRFTIQTEAQYNTGTVAASGTTLTGTDTTWVSSWVTAPSMRRVTISGRNEPYDVSAIGGATSATLADTWVGSSDSGLSYTMYRDTYPLPSDCGMARMVALYDPQLLYRLPNFSQPKFIDIRSQAPWLIAIPECFMVTNQTSEAPPRPQIQIYPASASVRVYHGWYFRRPDFITADGTYLDWPQEFDDMIWVRAALDHYRVPPFYSPKYLAEFKPMYADLYDRMKAAMDGQSAIDTQIEEAKLGRGPGFGGSWNPDPAGLFGGGSTSWS